MTFLFTKIVCLVCLNEFIGFPVFVSFLRNHINDGMCLFWNGIYFLSPFLQHHSVWNSQIEHHTVLYDWISIVVTIRCNKFSIDKPNTTQKISYTFCVHGSKRFYNTFQLWNQILYSNIYWDLDRDPFLRCLEWCYWVFLWNIHVSVFMK